MGSICKLGILSDIHYASSAEQARGNDYEWRGIANPTVRALVRLYRRFIWMHAPMNQNHFLDDFIQRAGEVDYVIANGDYSCNSAFVGVSDDAACASARECLDKLRHKFGDRLRANFGDHELGKISFLGGQGGMRLASWRRAREDLRLAPFWQLNIGHYALIGLASSLVALPVYEADALPSERADWWQLREQHLAEIRAAFGSLLPAQRVVLFCHDPTALPFLWHDETIRARLPQIEHTIIGHLHTHLVLWQSRILAGMPKITFLGHSAKRMSTALREARYWRPFRIRLCPALAGIELFKCGGYYTAELDPQARNPIRFCWHQLRRRRA